MTKTLDAFDDLDWYLDLESDTSEWPMGGEKHSRSGGKQVDGEEPENNDGREFCWWCGARTKKVPSPTPAKIWDICSDPKCGR